MVRCWLRSEAPELQIDWPGDSNALRLIVRITTRTNQVRGKPKPTCGGRSAAAVAAACRSVPQPRPEVKRSPTTWNS